ncbi:proliferation marker protein Ki-67-like [Latimeria chalumnae]|uniref:proliferation marker protein Ki-67-like n=1 Tax=Latimeria chalumnae TaxID=7897 RepID=UPI00313CA732
MPLYGKIVVIKRTGADGTHFPLTATSCLFGRKTECDIRIQLPHVSKEHCKIEVNENKEVILTNLSTVNPARLNGNIVQQPERLSHGDVFTIIDRSFRFEYPPESTPRKRRPSLSKKETLQFCNYAISCEKFKCGKPPPSLLSAVCSDIAAELQNFLVLCYDANMFCSVITQSQEVLHDTGSAFTLWFKPYALMNL